MYYNIIAVPLQAPNCLRLAVGRPLLQADSARPTHTPPLVQPLRCLTHSRKSARTAAHNGLNGVFHSTDPQRFAPNNGESNGKETVWKPGLYTMSTTITSIGINAIVPTSILTIALQGKPRSQLACRGRAIFLAGPPPCWRVVLV